MLFTHLRAVICKDINPIRCTMCLFVFIYSIYLIMLFSYNKSAHYLNHEQHQLKLSITDTFVVKMLFRFSILTLEA